METRMILLMIFTAVSGSFADTIGPEGDTYIIGHEGDSVTLNCKYEADSNYVWLYWYRQFPNTEPQFIMWKGARAEDGKKNIPNPNEFDSSTSRTSTQLIIKKSALKDSALYYCALWTDPVIQSDANENPIRPDNTSVSITEGHNITLSCTYDGSAYSLHWYRQTSGSTPEFLVLIRESDKYITKSTPPQAHMSIRLHDKQVYLEISSVKVTDSALVETKLYRTSALQELS
ncbi:uncharacterized protein LOC130416402 [Triplophysa dalaica]|uniref:uncharacterized protein LOC130416402 n=1 Tax=Triplophysa dalaica TaxID=1582913 RepID=UPI0024DF6C69|nr:uncharacterized protein LOC130416402 [Triplophysa dalaica]